MTTTQTPATAKQLDFLLALANKKLGTSHGFLSQVRNELGLSSFQVARITKSQASALISRLISETEGK